MSEEASMTDEQLAAEMLRRGYLVVRPMAPPQTPATPGVMGMPDGFQQRGGGVVPLRFMGGMA